MQPPPGTPTSVRASASFQALEPDELSFAEGDVLSILGDTGSPGWIMARRGNQVGLVPENGYFESSAGSALPPAASSALPVVNEQRPLMMPQQPAAGMGTVQQPSMMQQQPAAGAPPRCSPNEEAEERALASAIAASNATAAAEAASYSTVAAPTAPAQPPQSQGFIVELKELKASRRRRADASRV